MHKADGGGVILSSDLSSDLSGLSKVVHNSDSTSGHNTTSVQDGRQAVAQGATVGQVQGGVGGGGLVQTRFAGAWTAQVCRTKKLFPTCLNVYLYLLCINT